MKPCFFSIADHPQKNLKGTIAFLDETEKDRLRPAQLLRVSRLCLPVYREHS